MGAIKGWQLNTKSDIRKQLRHHKIWIVFNSFKIKIRVTKVGYEFEATLSFLCLNQKAWQSNFPTWKFKM